MNEVSTLKNARMDAEGNGRPNCSASWEAEALNKMVSKWILKKSDCHWAHSARQEQMKSFIKSSGVAHKPLQLWKSYLLVFNDFYAGRNPLWCNMKIRASLKPINARSLTEPDTRFLPKAS